MENKTLIGIDPGAKGGIAILHQDGRVEVYKMPETTKDLSDIIDVTHTEAMLDSGKIKCYLEQVSGFAGEGQPGSSAFNFGQGYGEIIGILTHAKIPFETITPQRWQKIYTLGTRGTIRGNYSGMSPEQAKAEKKRISSLNNKAKRDWKNKLKELAQRLYPDVTVTLGTSDALLILEYGRRLENMAAPQPNQPEMALS